MKPRFKNISGMDLTLCLNGPTYTIRKGGIIEGEQFARFLGQGGLERIPMLNEPVEVNNVLDIPESKTNVITEPKVEENVLDKPKVVENVITESKTDTGVAEAKKPMGRPAGSKNSTTAK